MIVVAALCPPSACILSFERHTTRGDGGGGGRGYKETCIDFVCDCLEREREGDRCSTARSSGAYCAAGTAVRAVWLVVSLLLFGKSGERAAILSQSSAARSRGAVAGGACLILVLLCVCVCVL